MKAFSSWLRENSPRARRRKEKEATCFSFDERTVALILPSKRDRLRLLRAVMVAADTIQAQRTAPVAQQQHCLTEQSSSSSSASPHTTCTLYQQRLDRLLQEELVPAAARALLLLSENDGSSDEFELVTVLAEAATLEWSSCHEKETEDTSVHWLACIALLLSNFLLYGNVNVDGGYDSRIRHVFKTACVHILSQEMLKRYEKDENWKQYIDEFDESMGKIFDSPLRATASSKQQSSASSSEQQGATSLEEEDANVTDQKLEGLKEEEVVDFLGDNEEKKLEPVLREEECTEDTGDQAGISTMCTEKATDTAQAMTDIVTTVDLVSTSDPIQSRIMFIATRKFEAIEREIATDIFRALSSLREQGKRNEQVELSEEERRKVTRKNVIRGLQIGTVGVVAGTLFAVTGGLAAPALAAGIASIGAAASSTTVVTVAVLTTVKAAAAVFGVGGGGLAAYKMKKRTQGLSEFRIRRENIEQNMYEGASDDRLRRGIRNALPQLHTTICLSGWLRENYKGADFQAAWGIQPTDPFIESKQELLKRHYAVHNPEKVKTCEADILSRRKRERKEFSWDIVWDELEKKYGYNPDHLLPLNVSGDAVASMSLSRQEQVTINDILVKAILTKQLDSCVWNPPASPSSMTTTCSSNPKSSVKKEKSHHDSAKKSMIDASFEHSKSDDVEQNLPREDSNQLSKEAEEELTLKREDSKLQAKEAEEELVVWDWQAIYGSDLHTITWETEILGNMCHIANTMTKQVTSQATRFALQNAAFVGAVLSAVALPSALMTAMQVIDDPYQIVILRADEAGKELARCLLQSDERRPVTLVGYSFGARVIFSCLVELARLQDLWEEARRQQGPSGAADPPVFDNVSQSDDVGGKSREPASIVEDVIFMGLPRVIDERMLGLARQVVGGRFVNCFTRNDWLLTLMFLCRGGTKTYGTHPVQNRRDIENYNVTNIVQAHSKYADAVPRILQLVGLGKPLALPQY